MMRLAAYAGTSTALAAGVVVHAFNQRANFYSACVYLAHSNACLMILTNLILLVVGTIMLGLQRLLYGRLRPIEVEQLYEKAWFAITETCLAMTIFRDEVGGFFLVMFVCLLIGKVWGWIGEGRVEALEQQPPADPRLFHARLSFSLFVSLIFDFALLNYAVGTVLRMARPNMMVMFAFEYAILAITSSSTVARYAISIKEALVIKQQTAQKVEERRAELRAARRANVPAEGRQPEQDAREANRAEENENAEIDESDIDVPGWEQKGQWVFYLDLATDFCKLVVYLAFFTILFVFYGIPIHIIRDVFLTLRSFLKRITDFLRYRRATRDMNERYPDASAEEIAREELCIVCREEMHVWQNNEGGTARVDERSRAKKLPCGHVLHFGCLRSWLERQQICPTCRRSVMDPQPQSTANGGRHPALLNGQPPHHLGRPGADGQNPAQNAGRVINLGPLRIGFGVGGPNMFQELAQQVRNGQAGPVQGRGANLNQGTLGLGLGFGGNGVPNAVPATATGVSSNLSVQTQILQLEAQITQDANNLRLNTEQLRLIHALQNELTRLRQVQAGMNMPSGPNVPQTPPTNVPRPGAPSVSVHVPDSQRPEMGAYHADLPPGMMIPHGWTLMPLQRVEGAGGNAIARENGTGARATSSRINGLPRPTPTTSSTLSQPAQPVTHNDTTAPHGEGSSTLPSFPEQYTPGLSALLQAHRAQASSSHSTGTATAPEPSSTPSASAERTSTPVPNWGSASSVLDGPSTSGAAQTQAPNHGQESPGRPADSSTSTSTSFTQNGSTTPLERTNARAATVEDVPTDVD